MIIYGSTQFCNELLCWVSQSKKEADAQAGDFFSEQRARVQLSS